MLQSRAFRFSVAGAVLLLLVGAWVAWQVWQVNKDLSDAVRHAEAIRTAVEDGDDAALDRELPGLRAASAAAADRTSGLTWRALSYLPVLGDDVEGVRVTSGVVDDLAEDGVEPLAEVADQLDDLLPREGAIDVEAVAGLKEPVTRAQVAFADADRRLSELDSSGYLARLDTQLDDLRRQVGRASRAMDSAEIATAVLPRMLGDGEPRTYLLAFQNNAEVRGVAGLPGAVSYIRAEGGRLSIVRHVRGGIFPEQRQPILPLSDPERALYGEVLGTYFVDANMTPDVPRAAELMRAHSETLFPGLRVDGVLLVDTVAMSHVLEATGPMNVDGRVIDSDNVVDELLHEAYLRLDAAAQDAFFADVARGTFGELTSGRASSERLIRALARSTDERRLHLHSFDEAEQAMIAGTTIAGEFVTDPDVERPQIAVTVNDTTGSKMSYFLRYDVDMQATSCLDGVQSFSARARLRSTAPPDAAQLPPDITGGGVRGVPPGHQVVTLRIFGPTGGEIDRFQLNAKPMDLVTVEQQGRPVGMTYIELEPGQTLDLAWTMKSRRGQVGDAQVTVTPGVRQGDSAMSLRSACR